MSHITPSHMLNILNSDNPEWLRFFRHSVCILPPAVKNLTEREARFKADLTVIEYECRHLLICNVSGKPRCDLTFVSIVFQFLKYILNIGTGISAIRLHECVVYSLVFNLKPWNELVWGSIHWRVTFPFNFFHNLTIFSLYRTHHTPNQIQPLIVIIWLVLLI